MGLGIGAYLIDPVTYQAPVVDQCNLRCALPSAACDEGLARRTAAIATVCTPYLASMSAKRRAFGAVSSAACSHDRNAGPLDQGRIVTEVHALHQVRRDQVRTAIAPMGLERHDVTCNCDLDKAERYRFGRIPQGVDDDLDDSR